ncbi:MAG: 50S ribosomal protein L35 [Omnitrophica WOR_2 bacterium RIFCSPHIGHO2_02_FULL_68_15]|nr:MAG: 50S ribosomal protein L35 [Omnitrophica WOR_2 bacterium RIFCSPHIGHO2_02_FULL_68_15]
MPKMKSNRSLRRRFRRTATGKLVRAHANRRHLLSHRSHKRKRQLRRPGVVAPAQARAIERLLPR